MARWQREQLDNLLGHVVCVHDYSEEYACRQQDEIQAIDLQAIDGVTSTEEKPLLIKEHAFAISDDPIQDHDSVHKVQELIHSYLVNDGGCH